MLAGSHRDGFSWQNISPVTPFNRREKYLLFDNSNTKKNFVMHIMGSFFMFELVNSGQILWYSFVVDLEVI